MKSVKPFIIPVMVLIAVIFLIGFLTARAKAKKA